MRGVDNGGIKGTGKAATFYIDKTAPEIMSLSLDPTYRNGQYSDVEPEITWNVKETYLSCVQVSINNGAFRTIGKFHTALTFSKFLFFIIYKQTITFQGTVADFII